MNARHLSAMMGGTPVAGVALVDDWRAHATRVELAVLEVLAAIPLWLAFCGPTGFYRSSDPEYRPDRPLPHFVVSALRADFPDRLNAEVEQTVPVDVTLRYAEPRAVLAADDRGSRDFATYLWFCLTSDPAIAQLKSATWGNRPLVDRPPIVRAVNFIDLGQLEQLEDGAPVSERELSLELGYVYTLEKGTGQPAGFDPEE